MAGVIVPLIAGIAPSIIQLIAGLVHKQAPIQETTNGPGTGPVKFANVFQQVIEGLQNAAAAGQIDKTLPPDETIKLVIQSVVTALKLPGGILSDAASPGTGILGTTAANVAVGPMTWVVVGGSLQVKPS